jgi:hypothetical protein
MTNSTTQRPMVKKANFYFGASLLVLVLTTALLLIMLRQQNKINSLAQTIVDKTETLALSEKQLLANIQDYQTTLELADIDQSIPEEVDINQITRDFDDYFAKRSDGAVNNSLNFSAVSEDETTKLNYVDATFSITSDEDNFYDFLKYIETSGISEGEARRLMEVRSIDISFSAQEQTDLNYRVTVRIYFKMNSNANTENE